jgi:homoserine O-succinyltransferase
MPLMIEGGGVPVRWAEKKAARSGALLQGSAAESECVRIAFINNMPDAALEDTEMQFFELIETAAGDAPVHVKLYSLSGVPRGERGQEHLDRFYFSSDDLLDQRFDGMIMTGTEPRQSNLRNEPYWPALANVLEWAESHTSSTILSCLAAHAGVLYSDAINRHPLPDKQFGVFAFSKAANHELTAGTADQIRFPHSRWNEVQADALISAGYTVLTQSSEGGVDSFVKKKKHSLFVNFQGHPEYDAQTLLKEFRRDIRRFLKWERETYPSMPKGYFGSTGEAAAAKFREVVVADRREELMEGFPETVLVAALQKTWQSSASTIYRNWLSYLATKRNDTKKCSGVISVHETVHKEGIVLPPA